MGSNNTNQNWDQKIQNPNKNPNKIRKDNNRRNMQRSAHYFRILLGSIIVTIVSLFYLLTTIIKLIKGDKVKSYRV